MKNLLKHLNHKISIRPSRKWVAGLWLVVVCLSVLQVFNEYTGVTYSIGNFFVTNGRGLNNELQYNIAAGQLKPLFTNDNYNRCQNKLGIDINLDLGNFNRDRLDNQLRKYFSVGVRHVVFSIESVGGGSGGEQVKNMMAALDVARRNFIIPIVNVKGVGSGGGKSATLVSFFNSISEGGDPFIAVTMPTYARRNAVEANPLSIEVATNLHGIANMMLTTPYMDLQRDEGSDGLLMYLTLESVTGLDTNNQEGLGGDYLYDILFVSAQNADEDFKNTDPNDPSRGKSLYDLTAHGLYSDPNRFSAQELVRYRNSNPVAVGGNLENRVNIYPFMQSIIYEFGPEPNTYKKFDDILLERMEYDFGLFSDDATVRSVILADSFLSDLKRKKGEKGMYQYLARLNKAGTNCNYDIAETNYTHAGKSVANSCDFEASPANGNRQIKNKVTCTPNGDLCQVNIKTTVQVGLPIRHCGNNSVNGTDSQPYGNALTQIYPYIQTSKLDVFNQYAGTASVGDKAYSVPWLDYCINNAGELMKYKDHRLTARVSENLASLREETKKELEEEKAFIPDFNPENFSLYALSPDNTEKVQEEYTDERVTVYGSRVAYDKKHTANQSLRTYEPGFYAQNFYRGNFCSGKVEAVNIDPQNMVYGSEMLYDEAGWIGSGAEMCYKLANPDDGELDAGPNGYVGRCTDTALAQNTASKACDCDVYDKDLWATTSWAQGVSPTQSPNITLNNVTGALRCRSSDPGKINKCLKYTGKDFSYVKSGVTYNSNQTRINKELKVDGIYDALAESYYVLQQELGKIGPGYKMIFNEKKGWRANAIVRSYSVQPEYEGEFRIERGRQNLMLNGLEFKGQNNSGGDSRIPGSSSSSSSSSGGAASSGGGQCKIGVNFAGVMDDVKIQTAKDLGYSRALIIVTGSESPDDVAAQASKLCSGENGLAPIIRSCYKGTCAFNSGADQAKFMNAVTSSSNWNCPSSVFVCGHNEPVTEYNPNPTRVEDLGGGLVITELGPGEGRFVSQCLSGIEKKDGMLITTPIFNGTHSWRKQNLANFAADFAANGGSTSKLDCIATNVYADPGNVSSVTSYLQGVKADLGGAFSGLGFCIMEMGVSAGEIERGDPNPESNAAVAVEIANNSDVLFALGFNWTGSSDEWKQKGFTPTDCGALALQNACGITSEGVSCEGGSSSGGDNGSGSEVGSFFSGDQEYPFEYYANYLSEGNNWNEYYYFFEWLYYIDEIQRILDVYGANATAGTGVYYDKENKRLRSGMIENFAGIFTCDEWRENPNLQGTLQDIRKRTGNPKYMPNCLVLKARSIASDNFVEDPLGQFLCDKGYDVGDECDRRQCVEISSPARVAETGEFNNPTCPLDTACLQGPLGSWSHMCATGINKDYIEPAFDLSQSGTLVAPEDGQIIKAEGWDGNVTQCSDGTSTGAEIQFMGDSGVHYKFMHLSFNGQQAQGMVGTRLVGGSEFKTGNGDTIGFYDIGETRCTSGPHLHTVAKIDTGGDFKNGQWVDMPQLFNDILGCSSTPSCTSTQACVPPAWVTLDSPSTSNEKPSSTKTVLSCDPGVGSSTSKGPKGCNEFGCMNGSETFEDSLKCAVATLNNDILAGKSLALTLDEYGPFCDTITRQAYCDKGNGETLCTKAEAEQYGYRAGMPFAYNLLKILNSASPIQCNAAIPNAQKVEHIGLTCDSFSNWRDPTDPDWQYYRAPLNDCGLDIMTWKGSVGDATVDEVVEHAIANVVYQKNTKYVLTLGDNGPNFPAVPKDKVRAVVEAAAPNDRNPKGINPYLLISIWGTEFDFGKKDPKCNVY